MVVYLPLLSKGDGCLQLLLSWKKEVFIGQCLRPASQLYMQARASQGKRSQLRWHDSAKFAFLQVTRGEGEGKQCAGAVQGYRQGIGEYKAAATCTAHG